MIGVRHFSEIGRVDWFLIGAFAIVKMVAVVGGPVHFPDSGLYVDLARGFLDGAPWIHQAEWSGLPPGHTVRTAGYPLMLAGTQWIFGTSAYEIITVALQSLATFVLFVTAYLIQRRILARTWVSLIFTLSATLSIFLLYDVTILSDSYSAFAIGFGLLIIIGAMLGAWEITLFGAVLLGVLWGWGVVIRPANLYFMIAPMVGLAVLSFRNGGGFRTIATLVLVFILPVLGQAEAHKRWNEYRTGERFLSTVGVYNWLWPLFTMDRIGIAEPFADGDPVDEAITLASAGQRGYPGIQATLTHLAEQDGWQWREIDQRTRDKWLNSVLHHPLAYAVTVLETMDLPKLSFTLLNPRTSIRDYVNLGPLAADGSSIPGSGKLKRNIQENPSFGNIADLVFLYGGRVFASVVMLLFVFGIPVSSVREWRRNRRLSDKNAALLFCWFSFFTVVGGYSLIHFEARMIMPVALPALVAAYVVLSDTVDALMARIKHVAWNRRNRLVP